MPRSFVEAFNRTVPCTDGDRGCHTRPGHGDGNDWFSTELWLVFRDEGTALTKFLYSQQVLSGGAMIERPSEFWNRLRTEGVGRGVLRELIRQMLLGVAETHRAGVTHRDLKPSNILIDVQPERYTIRLADYGSGVDAFTLAHLYDGVPRSADETREYRPPEVCMHPRTAGVGSCARSAPPALTHATSNCGRRC